MGLESGALMSVEHILIIGPYVDDNPAPVATIDRYGMDFTLVLQLENGTIKPLFVNNRIPTFRTEQKAIEWLMGGENF